MKIFWFNVRRRIPGSEVSMKTSCYFHTKEGAEKLCLEKGIPVEIIREDELDDSYRKSEATASYEYVELTA